MTMFTCSYAVPNTKRRRIKHVEADSFDHAEALLAAAGIEGTVDGELIEEGPLTMGFAVPDGSMLAVH